VIPQPSLRLAALELRRSWRRLAAAGAGIALAVASLVFLLALGLGLRATVLGELFPLDRLEVAREASGLDLFGVRLPLGGDTLDPAAIERLQQIPGVRRVYPKMKLTVPAVASGGGFLPARPCRPSWWSASIPSGGRRSARRFGRHPRNRACRDRDTARTYCSFLLPSGPAAAAYLYSGLASITCSSSARLAAAPPPAARPDRVVGVTADLTVGASMLRSTPARRRAGAGASGRLSIVRFPSA
jgi:hypothetical protein